MHFCQVQRPKVFIEGLINKIIIDREVEGVLPRPRRLFIADPVQSIRNDLDGYTSSLLRLFFRSLSYRL